MDNNTSILVIGGGPAGYVAALRASQLGAKVTVIESCKVGGTCLNRGCIPTKSLLECTHVYEVVKGSSTFGVLTDSASIDFAKVVARKDMIVKQLVSGVEYLLKSGGVEVIEGNAAFTGKDEVEITEQSGKKRKLTAQKFIIASGSLPVLPPIPGINSGNVITSEEALEIAALPKSMVIIGGGVIGVEFATIFASAGVKVTIVEMMSRLVPAVDSEVAETLKRSLKKKGVSIYLNSKVESISDSADGKIVKAINEKGQEIDLAADRVLVSVGRKANTKGLNLENAGVKTERGYVVVNEKMETNIPNIYAAGDVTGGILLAHVAFREGETAAENALGHQSAVNYKAVPNCIFTRPEIGSVGLSEEKAKEAGYQIKIGRFPFKANGKALVEGETDGFVKVIADAESDKVLGVHIIGPHATELILEGALGVKLGVTVKDIAKTIHAHPTLGEAMLESVLDVDGLALHIPRRR